uniref:estradiol 17-beta-dehydrogenase 8-like n=1 Tax=Styela clava TaxID=7725 RepID=UPI001939741F|nr:estradiol 17-beta-dehydrogenase 8-like [Styela clava]
MATNIVQLCPMLLLLKRQRNRLKPQREKLGIEATILVNNAGIEKGAFLDDLTEQDYDDVMGVNAKGTFLMSKEFLLSVKDGSDGDGSPRGVIVNMSSMAGKRGFPEKSNYSASKFAIVGLTKTTAMEYGKHKVRCNAVLPSFINTPMILSLDEQTSNILKQQILWDDLVNRKKLLTCVCSSLQMKVHTLMVPA